MYSYKYNLCYYSYTVENPSSAINDGEFNKHFFISPLKAYNERVKRDVQNAGSRSVYVTIQGQEDSNVYSLDTIEGNHTSRGDQLKTSILCVITSFILFLLNNISSIFVWIKIQEKRPTFISYLIFLVNQAFRSYSATNWKFQSGIRAVKYFVSLLISCQVELPHWLCCQPHWLYDSINW